MTDRRTPHVRVQGLTPVHRSHHDPYANVLSLNVESARLARRINAVADSARSMPRWVAAALWATLTVGLFALIGFVVLPPIIKSVVTTQLSERLHRPVSIREVLLNPFTWSVQISGFVIREPQSDQRFASLE